MPLTGTVRPRRVERKAISFRYRLRRQPTWSHQTMLDAPDGNAGNNQQQSGQDKPAECENLKSCHCSSFFEYAR